MAHVYAVETTPKLTDEDAEYFLRLGDFLTAYETYLSLYGNKAILDSANKPSGLNPKRDYWMTPSTPWD
jgi:hypothetical protein